MRYTSVLCKSFYKSKVFILELYYNIMNIIILHNPTIFNEEVIPVDLVPIIDSLSKNTKVYNYFFKFSYYKNKFDLEDIEFENASIDIYNTFEHLENYLIIGINHSCPYALYFANKYSKKCLGVICYPYRYYCKESYERRLWKFTENNGWSTWIKKYSIDDYLININNERLQQLLSIAGDEEINIVYLIMDLYLQKNSNLIPTHFQNPTVLYTRLDLDTKSIIKFNYDRKDIREMKKIFTENDALQQSMIWNFSRVKYDNYLKENNGSNLKIKYIISGQENYWDIVDEVNLFLLSIEQKGGTSLQIFKNYSINQVNNCAGYIFTKDKISGIIYFGCVRKVYSGGRINKHGQSWGAAGTDKKYWGKWTSPGGTLTKTNNTGKSLLKAVVDEINDEINSGNIFNGKNVLIKWMINSNKTLKNSLICHLAEKSNSSAIFLFEIPSNKLFYKLFPKNGYADQKLIKSSFGEIDAVQSFSTNEIKILQQNYLNKFSNNYFPSYFLSTFNNVIKPYMCTINNSYKKKWYGKPDITYTLDKIPRNPVELIHAPW